MGKLTACSSVVGFIEPVEINVNMKNGATPPTSLRRIPRGALRGRSWGSALSHPRGHKGKERPARVEAEEEGEGCVNWRRELNFLEAQIVALEREIATLRASPQTSSASTIMDKDGY